MRRGFNALSAPGVLSHYSQAQLRDALTQYRELVDRIPVGVYKLRMSKTGETRFDFVSTRFCDQLGMTVDQLINDAEATFSWVHPEDLGELIRLGELAKKSMQPFVWEGRYNGSNGMRWMHVESAPALQPNGDILWNGMQFDITERKQMEDAVRQFAFHDALTMLPNRRLLIDRLSQTMVTSKRSGRCGAVMFLDLDNLKSLNDTHGHGAGDLLLIEVARRLTSCVREIDTVARTGGDEFVVLLGHLDADEAISTARAGAIAQKIRIKLAEPYLLPITHEGRPNGMVEHHCTASIGVVVFIDHEVSQDDILKCADEAMYEAKHAGRNTIKFRSKVAHPE